VFFGNKGIIGLDIGSASLKLAELKSSRSGYQLKNIGEAILPPGSIVKKVITNRDAVAGTLLTLVRDLGVKNKNVVISISGHSVIIKKVTLPSMSKNELAESIPWELEQYLPQSIEDVNFDYQVLPEVSPEGNMDVLIVAAKKDITNDYVSLVRSVGLNPMIVDVDVFALENMYEVNYSDVGGVIALVNMGASVTNINILKDGVSIFSRDITTGGIQFTEWIMKEQNLGFEEAEQSKQNLSQGEIPFELERTTNDYIDLITGEVKRTLDFFSSNFSQDRISKIILSGGSSKVPNIIETLQDITDIDVEIVNPFNNIAISDSEFDPNYISDISPKMGVVVGLALRRMGDN
jgi:type IV pilus assembly protein PilM